MTARSSFVSRQAACNGWRCDFLPILLLSIDAHTRITSPGHIQVERDLLISVRELGSTRRGSVEPVVLLSHCVMGSMGGGSWAAYGVNDA